MKRSRSSEEQIIGILEEQEADVSRARPVRVACEPQRNFLEKRILANAGLLDDEASRIGIAS